MKIFSITPQYDAYKSFVPKDPDSGFSIRCKGKVLDWPGALEVVSDEDDVGVPEADFSLLNIGSIVLSEGVFEKLAAVAEEFGQVLPLKYGDRQLYLWNVTNVIDCLDKEKSRMNEFGGVTEPVFRSIAIPALSVFKIREDNYTGIFCTDKFIDLVDQDGFTGLVREEFDVV